MDPRSAPCWLVHSPDHVRAAPGASAGGVGGAALVGGAVVPPKREITDRRRSSIAPPGTMPAVNPAVAPRTVATLTTMPTRLPSRSITAEPLVPGEVGRTTVYSPDSSEKTIPEDTTGGPPPADNIERTGIRWSRPKLR